MSDSLLPKPPRPLGESALVALIHSRYKGEAYATLAQVRNQTGYSRVTRTADAMVMSLWPSRGIWLAGFEVKSTRNDWLREVKDPAKAEELTRFCHYWWIVTANDSIARLDEIPETWGLMAADATGKKLKVVKEAPRREPAKLTYEFVASIFRNVTAGMVPVAAVEKMAEERAESRVASAAERAKHEASNEASSIKREHRRLTDQVESFKEQTGVDIKDFRGAHWSWNKGAPIAMADMLRGFQHHQQKLQELLKQSVVVTSSIQQVLAITPPEPEFSI